jgi:uncharacterized radical SAM superfamily Fe-S cluster-containing enzyme
LQPSTIDYGAIFSVVMEQKLRSRTKNVLHKFLATCALRSTNCFARCRRRLPKPAKKCEAKQEMCNKSVEHRRNIQMM